VYEFVRLEIGEAIKRPAAYVADVPLPTDGVNLRVSVQIADLGKCLTTRVTFVRFLSAVGESVFHQCARVTKRFPARVAHARSIDIVFPFMPCQSADMTKRLITYVTHKLFYASIRLLSGQHIRRS